jgi:hypothetical protein
MRIPNASLLLLSLALTLAGCSSTPTHVNKGPVRAQTFQFVNTGKPLPAYAAPEQQVHTMVQSVIKESLAQRKVQHVNQGADVTVAYLIITGNNAVTSSIDEYFGYGRGASDLRDKAHDKYTSSNNPNYFEAGTLVIDIVDSKTWKLLERGYATRALLQNPTPEQRMTRLREVVEQILKDVEFKQ